MGEILGRFTALPLAHRSHADVVALGSCGRSRAGLGWISLMSRSAVEMIR